MAESHSSDHEGLGNTRLLFQRQFNIIDQSFQSFILSAKSTSLALCSCKQMNNIDIRACFPCFPPRLIIGYFNPCVSE